jgi:hypothetical protein
MRVIRAVALLVAVLAGTAIRSGERLQRESAGLV